MSKLSLLQKEKKRFLLFNKYYYKNYNLKKYFKSVKVFNLNNLKNIYNFQKIPRNSKGVRIRNRCYLTGRPRGVFRRFGLSRSLIRAISFKGYAPGLFKASW